MTLFENNMDLTEGRPMKLDFELKAEDERPDVIEWRKNDKKKLRYNDIAADYYEVKLSDGREGHIRAIADMPKTRGRLGLIKMRCNIYLEPDTNYKYMINRQATPDRNKLEHMLRWNTLVGLPDDLVEELGRAAEEMQQYLANLPPKYY